MRYTVIFLLLSACASVPESQTETYSPGGAYSGPNNWGYAQGNALSPGASCLYPGYQAVMGPPYFGSYNCATPLLFYSRNPYFPYYSALTPVAPAYGAHPWRRHTLGRGTGGKPAAHVASGSGGAKKRR